MTKSSLSLIRATRYWPNGPMLGFFIGAIGRAILQCGLFLPTTRNEYRRECRDRTPEHLIFLALPNKFENGGPGELRTFKTTTTERGVCGAHVPGPPRASTTTTRPPRALPAFIRPSWARSSTARPRGPCPARSAQPWQALSSTAGPLGLSGFRSAPWASPTNIRPPGTRRSNSHPAVPLASDTFKFVVIFN